MAHLERSAAAWRRRLAVSIAVTSLAAMAPAMTAAQTTPATDPRALSATGQSTRFVIGLDKAVDFQVSALASPNRVVVDLPDVRMRLPTPPGDTPVGLVKSFRGGLSAAGKSRVIIDVTAPVVVERSVIDRGTDGKSPRLVIDIAPVPAGTSRAALKTTSTGLAPVTVQPPVPRPAIK